MSTSGELEAAALPNADSYAEQLRVRYGLFAEVFSTNSDAIIVFETRQSDRLPVMAFLNNRASGALAPLFGVDQEAMQAAIGSHWAEINPGHSPVSPQFEADCVQVFTDGEERKGQVELASPGGGLIIEYKLSQAGLDQAGNVTRVLAGVRDVSERVHMLQQIEDLKLNLEFFMRLFSHNIGNELTGIFLNLYLLQRMLSQSADTGLRAQAADKLLGIQSHTREIQEMAELFLNLTAIQQGRFAECEITDVQPAELAEKLLRSHRDADINKHQYDLDLQLPETVRFDSKYITHILKNLLSNAAKYSPPETPITLSGRLVEGWLELSVTDEGEGIAQENLPRLFRQFERFSDKRVNGTGVGLYLAQCIAQAHGGEITVVSEKGKGSTFTLRIPQ